MRTKAALIALIAMAFGATANVQAGTTALHATRLSVLLTELGTAQSGTTTFVGLTQGPPLGPGTIRVDANTTASPFHYRVEIFCERGTIKGRGTAALPQQPARSLVLSGPGRIASGPGRFRGATSGRIRVTGNQAPDDN